MGCVRGTDAWYCCHQQQRHMARDGGHMSSFPKVRQNVAVAAYGKRNRGVCNNATIKVAIYA